MTRQQARKMERELKSRGVYQASVVADREFLYVESYPLTAVIRQNAGVHPQLGPYDSVKITDAGVARMGEDSTVFQAPVYIGQHLIAKLAEFLTIIHPPAYERAQRQDAAALKGK